MVEVLYLLFKKKKKYSKMFFLTSRVMVLKNSVNPMKMSQVDLEAHPGDGH